MLIKSDRTIDIFAVDWVCLAGISRTSVTTGRIRGATAHEWNEYLEA
ncbi:MAG: hypothetical protein ACPGMQ_08965 [Pirellulales bacterium]